MLITLLAGCGGRAYVHDDVDVADMRDRAETRSEGPVQVTAAVPGREETKAIFGLDLYDMGIQPVWLEIGNSGTDQLRYAPVSTDRYYFSPLEVAYKNRRGYSDEAREQMEARFQALSMPRYIDPGETRSGYVLTHADAGAKGFNVDIFGGGEYYDFTFILRVPGFTPDYANVEFESIYKESQVETLGERELLNAVRQLPCCSVDDANEDNKGAINIFLVSDGPSFLGALLQSGWIETAASEATDETPHFLFGRQQDAIFRYVNLADGSFYELRLWLAPYRYDGQTVWAGQVRHFFKFGAFDRADPDIDNARTFALQSFVYGQALQRYALLEGDAIVPVETFWSNLVRPAFFSDGTRFVMWLSEDPVSMVEVEFIDTASEEASPP